MTMVKKNAVEKCFASHHHHQTAAERPSARVVQAETSVFKNLTQNQSLITSLAAKSKTIGTISQKKRPNHVSFTC
jgi:hypothetical protein